MQFSYKSAIKLCFTIIIDEMTNKFFITTPIYYSNDIPHVGHMYASLICDISSRYKRLLGYDVKFSTGVDENSQKTVQKAAEQKMDINEYLDKYAALHQETWDRLNISYTDFIRTTSEKHKAFVQEVLQKTYDNGDIYQGEYEGLYCVGCEAFKKETDLVEKDGKLVCPDHLKEPEKLKEKNWFFRLSKYQDKLEQFYADHPDFVTPSFRFNEMIAFTKWGLEDFSISRETNKFGIPLPFDPEHVTYVRYDALLNYLTVCQWGDEAFWPGVHVLGKDIARFHVIYRPAMLMSAWYELPKKEIITGFFTVDGQKMSKSLGNTVKPLELVEKYWRDAAVFYLFYDLVIGSDGDFSYARLENTRESMLSAWWGNLVSRVTKLSEKNGITQWKKHVECYDLCKDDKEALQEVLSLTPGVLNEMLENKGINYILQLWYRGVQAANLYMQTTEPWIKLKNAESAAEGKQHLEFLLFAVKQLALLSAPFLTEGFAKFQQILGNEVVANVSTADTNDNRLQARVLEEFSVNLSPDILYQKLEISA